MEQEGAIFLYQGMENFREVKFTLAWNYEKSYSNGNHFRWRGKVKRPTVSKCSYTQEIMRNSV